MHLTPADGPLHGYELAHLMLGHVLLRHTRRYPVIMMWMVRHTERTLG